MKLPKIPILQAAVALMILTQLTRSAEVSPSYPNIVFILSDDQGWQDYGFMGHPHIKTPRLDRLSAESLTFPRGYTPVPLCRPSLSTIATGLYPHQHGVTGNDPKLPVPGTNPQKGRTNPEFAPIYQKVVDHFTHQPNLIRDLTGKGYVSFQTGKWWEGDPVKSAGFSKAMTAGTGKGDRHGGNGLAIGRDGMEPIRDFIANHTTAPFLLWYAPMLPHAPHNPPAALLAKYSSLTTSKPLAAYWASIEWFDQTCGELLDCLDQHHMRENTIIIYICDNGWIQDPRTPNRFEPRSKLTAFEGGIRTPIMISWPAHLKPRMDTEHLASSIDLWPTLAALIGTDRPGTLPGINLADTTSLTTRTTLFGEQYAHDIADVDQPTASMQNLWIIDGWWKLIRPDSSKLPGEATRLFNLKEDPREKQDLADKEPARVRRMSDQLDQWWTHPPR